MVPKRIRLLALLAPFFLVACTLSQNNGVSKNMPAQQGNDLLSMVSPAGRYAVVIQRAVEKKCINRMPGGEKSARSECRSDVMA